MNNRILELAKRCGLKFHYDEFEGLETFYKAAFNDGIHAAYNTARNGGFSLDGVTLTATQVMSLFSQIAEPIKHLEMK